ncbi:hypothetical protein [Pseudodesulfovibrio karagichevae]|uniref:Uncharacterized protein n=1 Tax=Pseudodesulfovibrio karagichevae TaxID=3239305 RepID=A0ABV4K1Y7_9BACT
MNCGHRIIKTIKWIVISVALLSVLFAGGCWLLLELTSPSHDSDDALLHNFANNRAIFEGIVAKVQDDGDIIRIGKNWYKLADWIARSDNPDRIVQYRKLFKEISIDSGIHVTYSSAGKARVLFYSSWTGFLSPGSCKGYAYEPYPIDAAILVDSIDGYKPKANRSSFWRIYRGIKEENNWYLYYESDE